jgi:hypothetical protein
VGGIPWLENNIQLVDLLMKKFLLLLFTVSFMLPWSAHPGQLWRWSKDRWEYVDDNGHRSEGWQWSKDRTSWSDDCGHRWEVWEWAPGRFEIDDE